MYVCLCVYFIVGGSQGASVSMVICAGDVSTVHGQRPAVLFPASPSFMAAKLSP